jgi:hypothetical protein
MRALRSFGMFWYDFLVGDRPELFVGSIALLALVGLAIRGGLDSGLAGLLLIALVFGLGGFSIWRATRRRPG